EGRASAATRRVRVRRSLGQFTADGKREILGRRFWARRVTMERQLAHRIPIATAAVVLARLLFGGPMSRLVAATSGPNLVERNGSISVSSRLVFQNPRGLHDYYAFFYAPAGSIWSYRLSSHRV